MLGLGLGLESASVRDKVRDRVRVRVRVCVGSPGTSSTRHIHDSLFTVGARKRLNHRLIGSDSW